MQRRVDGERYSKPHQCTFAWVTLRGNGVYVEIFIRTCSRLQTCKDKRRLKFAGIKQHIAEGHKHGIKYDPGLKTFHVAYSKNRKRTIALSMLDDYFVIQVAGDERGGIICSTKPFEDSTEMHWWAALQYMEDIYVHGWKVGKYTKPPRRLEAGRNSSWSGMSNCQECSQGRKRVHFASIRHDEHTEKTTRQKVAEIHELGRLMLAEGQDIEEVDKFVRNRLDNLYDGFEQPFD